MEDEQQSIKASRGKEIGKGFLTIGLHYGIPIVGYVFFYIFSLFFGISDEKENFYLKTLVCLVFVIIYFKTLKTDIKRLTKKDLIFTLLITALKLALNIGCYETFNYFNLPRPMNEAQILALQKEAPILSLFKNIIIAPIAEEFFYRKAISQIISNKIAFVLVSSVLFALTHGINLYTFVYLIMGVIYAITYLKTNKNVVAVMIMHAINNLVADLMRFF